jgi:hypothetical protein
MIRLILGICFAVNMAVILTTHLTNHTIGSSSTASATTTSTSSGALDEIVAILMMAASPSTSSSSVLPRGSSGSVSSTQELQMTPPHAQEEPLLLSVQKGEEKDKENEPVHLAAAVDTKKDPTPPSSSSSVCDKRVLTTSNPLMFLEEYSYFENNSYNNDQQLPTNETTNTHSCTQHNTQAWLTGPRFGNVANDTNDEDDFIPRLILQSPFLLLHPNDTVQTPKINGAAPTKSRTSHARFILGTSLCYDQSRFMNDTESAVDEKSIRLWSVRLIYLAIHYHQHRLAIPEAMARYHYHRGTNTTTHSDSTASTVTTPPSCPELLLQQHNVGALDYECGPHAKYLLMPLSGNGIGANVRGSIVVALIAGLQMNRIVLFVNNSPVGDVYLRGTWPSASCDRHDYQCFFMPTSPCTVTHEDIQNAYVLTKPEIRTFLNKNGVLPVDHANDKVLNFYGLMQPMIKVPHAARLRLSTYAHALVDRVPCHDPRLSAMRLGADLILQDDAVRPGYNYAAAAEKIQHAMAFYFLRPRLSNVKRIEAIISEIVPSDMDAERTVGLPIRGAYGSGGVLYVLLSLPGGSKFWTRATVHSISHTLFTDSLHSQKPLTNAMGKASVSRLNSTCR